MRIGLLTSRSARRLVEEVSRGINDVVEVVEVPVPVISFLSARTLARIIESRRDLRERLSRLDLVIIPGRVKGDASEIERVIGKPVYKGPHDIGLIPVVVKHVSEGGVLDRRKPAEEVISGVEPGIEYETAFKLGSLSVPRRGPPVLVVTEIHPGVPEERVASEARRHVREGASIILVGAGDGVSPESLARRVETVLDIGPGAVIAEAPTRMHAEAALSAGAHGLSVSPESLPWLIDVAERDTTVIIGDRSVDRLSAGIDLLSSVGIYKVIVDPVVGLPLIDLAESIERYLKARGLERPILFTAANAVEELEADPHGIHAVLASIAVEVGASLYLVVEETYKSVHGTAEAWEALRLATHAWARRSTPRGLYSRLYVVRQQSPPPSQGRVVDAERVDYVEPVMDRRGVIEVHVDHDRGVIVAVYRELPSMRVVAAVEGVHPNSIARALIRRVGLDPEHAAYLGAELAKADIALRLGITYTQDNSVVTPIWEKVRSVEGDGKQPC